MSEVRLLERLDFSLVLGAAAPFKEGSIQYALLVDSSFSFDLRLAVGVAKNVNYKTEIHTDAMSIYDRGTFITSSEISSRLLPGEIVQTCTDAEPLTVVANHTAVIEQLRDRGAVPAELDPVGVLDRLEAERSRTFDRLRGAGKVRGVMVLARTLTGLAERRAPIVNDKELTRIANVLS